MNHFAIVFCVIALASTAFAKPADEKYTDKYDSIDYRDVVKNDRLFNKYFECIIYGTKCTKEGKELKEHISEALEHDCAKCTDKQKEGTKYVLEYLAKDEKKKERWRQLVDKYDPEHKYRSKYEKQIKAAGVQV